MDIQINSDLKIPLYYQLKEEIKKRILDGTYKEGDLIPSERELIENHNLSSTTVRRALNDLVHENYLQRKAGKGTFVQPRRVRRDLRKVLSFTTNMNEMGLTPSTKVLEKQAVPADDFVADRLGVGEGQQVMKLRRLRMADGVPMMLETRFIRLDLCPTIMDFPLDSSLWEVFTHEFGKKPHRHHQGFRIANVNQDEAGLLGLAQGSPVFLILGVTYLEDGQAIECDSSFYRGDRYELTFEAVAD